MSDRVNATAILWSPQGYSSQDTVEPITSNNVDMYEADEETIEQASKELEKLGFTVEAAGAASLSFSGELTRFERVFHTKLRRKPSLEADAETLQEIYFEAVEPIQIPESLSGIVAGVELPERYTLHR